MGEILTLTEDPCMCFSLCKRQSVPEGSGGVTERWGQDCEGFLRVHFIILDTAQPAVLQLPCSCPPLRHVSSFWAGLQLSW